MNEFPKVNEKLVTTIVVCVLVILLLAIGVSTFKKRGRPTIDPNTYQAVFLDNNQQYFGHLQNLGTRYPSLTDIYYVRIQGPAVENPAQQQFSLIKLGNEIHGPQDVMYLNWDQVAYWENLKPDSEVVKGINKEKAQRAAPQPAPVPVPAPAPAPVK